MNKKNKYIAVAVTAAILAFGVHACAETKWLNTKHNNPNPGVVSSGGKTYAANVSPIISLGEGWLGVTAAPERGYAPAPLGRNYTSSIAGPGLSAKLSSWLNVTGNPYEMSDTEKSAFQLGFWELASGDTDKNLTTGNFSVVNVNSAVVTTTETWLSQVNMAYNMPNFTVWSHPVKDDIIVIPSPIPEPKTVLLLALGVIGILMLTKRTNHE